MPLRVTSFCSYLVTDDYSLWRPEDHNANKFIKALKGEPLNGYAYVPLLGARRHLSNDNLDESIRWFADLVAHEMLGHNIAPPLILVPVPNSSTTTKSGKKPRTLKLARAIGGRVGDEALVSDCLRWKVDLGSARKGSGGTRKASILYQNLELIEKVRKRTPHILIDDAKASGGHLQACAAKLRTAGANVKHAFCGGYTVHEPPENAFDILDEELEDFEP